MKNTYFFFIILLFTIFSNQSFAQCTTAMPCFTDDYGYVFHFSNVQLTGLNVYTAEGTNIAYPSSIASIRLDLTNGISKGAVRIAVRNGEPDGCLSYSDSFIYVGTVHIVKGANNMVSSFKGNGIWRSYCYGRVLDSGKWTASGPCGSGNSYLQKQTGVSPVDGKEKIANYNKGITAAPNPTTSFATISYILKDAGKTNITIFNSMNQPVKTLVNAVRSPGSYSVQWNLLNANGIKVSPGIYRAVLTTTTGIWSSNIQVPGN